MAEKDFSNLLYSAVMTLENDEECKHLFEDLCTPKEIKSIAQRLAVAKMLSEGRIYNDIVEETGASTATISRVNRTMSKGTKTVLERLRINNDTVKETGTTTKETKTIFGRLGINK